MFNPTYAKLKDDGDNQSVNQAIAIIYNNLNQLSGGSGIIQPLKSPVTISSVYAINPLSQGMFTILIPVQYLVASAGGPFTMTFTTNKINTMKVKIPIAAFGDLIFSGNLLLNIYVDNLGNVTSDAWTIVGSNINGIYAKSADTSMRCWLSNSVPGSNINTAGDGQFYALESWTFPSAFIDTSYVFNPNARVPGHLVYSDPLLDGKTAAVCGFLVACPVSLVGVTIYNDLAASGRWE
jgi:hypothetical protein